MWYDAFMNYLARTDTFIASLGLEAYRVGGSVRDELLGRRVKDADYMIRGASLDEILKAIRRAGQDAIDPAKATPLKLRDGRQVGWRVAKRGLGLIEIAMPRTERPRALSPEEKLRGGGVRGAFEIVVDPTLGIAEDAIRRDFTFNALYKLVPDGPVADPTACGLYDLQHRLVRTTHPDSFRDDPLRTLRALRFVSVLGYDLSSDTELQMAHYSKHVTGLSAKGYASGTVLDELTRMLMGPDCVKALRIARDTGVLAALLPELAPMIGFDQGSKYHDLTTDEHTFKALETAAHVDAPLRVRMALLFHDSGKPESAWVGDDGRKHYYATTLPAKADPENPSFAVSNEGFDGGWQTEDHEVVGARIWRETAKRLNAPKALRDEVAHLIEHHMVTVVGKVKGAKVRRERVKHGDSMLRDLYLHRMCDISGKGKPNKKYMAQIGYLEQVRQEAERDGVPASTKELQIGGADLKALGIEGREIGRVLNLILDEVVCQPNDQLLSREWQLERAEAIAREVK